MKFRKGFDFVTDSPCFLAALSFKTGPYVSGTKMNAGIPTAVASMRTSQAVQRQPRWLSVTKEPRIGPACVRQLKYAWRG